MSDQRPEWMPSRESLLPMCHNESLYDNCKHDYAGEEVEESHYRTGLRAQLHELESLVVGHEGSHMVDRVKARIEEIREELG